MRGECILQLNEALLYTTAVSKYYLEACEIEILDLWVSSSDIIFAGNVQIYTVCKVMQTYDI